VESLSREELIKLVRKQKQMATIIEMKAQKQLETAKKEAEESAKQAEVYFTFFLKFSLGFMIML
jgi:hypothetical protein